MKKRPEYDAEIIGRNLRGLRKAHGYSVSDICEYLCIGTKQAVYKYEKGKSLPPLDNFGALMELYNVDFNFLVTEHTHFIR